MSLSEKIFALPEPRTLIAVILGEFIGTYFLLICGCVCMIEEKLSLLQIAVGWGFVVGNVVQVFGPISGAHFNPGVTVAAVILGTASPALAVIYFICQFSGSTLGILTLKVLLPKKYWDSQTKRFGAFCMTHPDSDVSDLEAVAFEFLATSFLILIVCSAHDRRTAFHRDSFALKVAGVIIADVLWVGPLTGASLNTARTFGPAVVTNYWTSHWVYWAGPLLAGIITPIVYLAVWMPKPQPDALDTALVENLYHGNSEESNAISPFHGIRKKLTADFKVKLQAGPVRTQAEPVRTQAEPVRTQAEPVRTQGGPSRTQAGPVQTQPV